MIAPTGFQDAELDERDLEDLDDIIADAEADEREAAREEAAKKREEETR